MLAALLPSDEYRSRLHRLLRRWDVRGLLPSDAKAHDALALLKAPRGASAEQLEAAERVTEQVMHPVLEQPIPSAFRLCSFMPVTATLCLGMLSSKAPSGVLWFHWLFQSHSAGMRYCNYADTSRPLDGRRMLQAYGLSTLAACGVALASLRAVERVPRLRPLGVVLPHLAVGCAGAVSTVGNAQHELEHGVDVTDRAGEVLGVSRVAARASVTQAVLFHSLLIPSCALLAPVVLMRTVVVPRLLHKAPTALWPASAALVFGGVCLLTPAAAALVPPTIAVPAASLEPELARSARERGLTAVFSSRFLY